MQEQRAHALARGALESIPTCAEFVEDSGIRFLVRIAFSLARKDEALRGQREQETGMAVIADPFLPYDKDLFVADLSDTHVCLLNKFNVVDHHILIVTRAFEDQECLLDLADFEALWTCMAEFEGLGFYNGGEVAGASQRHKHLQMVPLPLTEGGPKVPIEPVLGSIEPQGEVSMSPRFPFRHAFSKLAPDTSLGPSSQAAARLLLSRYRALLHAVGLRAEGGAGSGQRQSGPYNLLVTRDWMLLVPRSTERFCGISVNALGFAGALLVRDERQLQLLKECGPMVVLRHLAVGG